MTNEPKSISMADQKIIVKEALALVQRKIFSFLLFGLIFIGLFGFATINFREILFIVFPVYFCFGLMISYCADHNCSVSYRGMASNVIDKIRGIVSASMLIIIIGSIISVIGLVLWPDEPSQNFLLSSGFIDKMTLILSPTIIYLLCYYLVVDNSIHMYPLILFNDVSNYEATLLNEKARDKNRWEKKMSYIFMAFYFMFIVAPSAVAPFLAGCFLFFPSYFYCLYRAIFIGDLKNKELEKSLVLSPSLG